MPQPSKHTQPTRFDALAVLGLTGTATAEQITAAYRRLAKNTHPDATGRTDPAATDRFTQITLAYHRLMPQSEVSVASGQPQPHHEQPPSTHLQRAARLAPPAPSASPPPSPPLVAGPAIVTPSPPTPLGTGSRRST
jgi:hypothetical protein